MVIFFTIPPPRIRWPWVLVNQFNVLPETRLLSWVHAKMDYEEAKRLTPTEAEELMFKVYIEKLARVADPSFRCVDGDTNKCAEKVSEVLRNYRIRTLL